MLTNSVLQVSQGQELGLSDSAWLARVCVCAKWLQLGLTLCNTWTIAHQLLCPWDSPSSGLVHWDDPEGWDREEGRGAFRMGNTCTPVADSCQCMAKPLQYCKVISLQLK